MGGGREDWQGEEEKEDLRSSLSGLGGGPPLEGKTKKKNKEKRKDFWGKKKRLFGPENGQ